MSFLTLTNHTRNKKISTRFFKTLLGRAARIVGLRPSALGLSLNLVGAPRMRALNRRYRGHNAVTDVLSFPLGKNVNGGIMELGDIFICLPRAQQDAESETVSLETKLTFLTVHGFLHLLGYDHISSRDRKKMFSLQNKIL